MSQVPPSTIIEEPIPAIVRRGRPVKTQTPTVLIPPMPEDLPKGIWSEQATKVLKERYLIRDNNGEVTETEDQMCWRVAWDIAYAEANYGGTYDQIMAMAREYYRLMVTHEFLPNSPTLMNAGKNNGLQYSACYVIPVDDSIEGIFDGIKWQAIVHKSGGGTGFSFSRLRGSNARVGSTKGVASGPVSFMKIYDAATEQIKQGGMRRGANMGILRVDHPDVMSFIHCKDNGGINNFNISVAITDAFIKAYRAGTSYDLIDPKNNSVVGQLDARKVMDEIADGAWKTGDPGLIFIDQINSSCANPVPTLGPIEATNPCGEQPLYPFDACNLGSIFLTYFVENKQVNWNKLEKTVKTAVRFLDSVIERNPFPLPQIKDTVTNIRRIGLGVGGWADLLAKLEIPYNSNEALELAEKLMKFVNDKGHEASQELAKERGAFPLFPESIFKDDKPMRNSTVTTIAPTGTIGIIANASTGVEPFFAIAYKHYVKTNAIERTLLFFNPLFEEYAKNQSWYTDEVKEKIASEGTLAHIQEIPDHVKKVFATAHDIEPIWHVKMQAAFQKNTDNAVSKTINMPNSATREDILKAYIEAYETGCRGITVYRDGCKDVQVLNLGITNGHANGHAQPVAELRGRPQKLTGNTYRVSTPVGHAFITINSNEDNQPFEIFINVGHAGTDIAADAEAIGRLISMSLRIPSQLSPKEISMQVVEQLRGIGGSNHIGFGVNKVKSLADAIAKILSEHMTQDKETTVPEAFQAALPLAAKRDLCPSCGAAAFIFEEGCSKCLACSYSKC